MVVLSFDKVKRRHQRRTKKLVSEEFVKQLGRSLRKSDFI